MRNFNSRGWVYSIRGNTKTGSITKLGSELIRKAEYLG
jgi:hypothetical protein